jgi:hypothetical protein
LCLGTQDAVFRFNNGNHVTARYTNNEILNVAVVLNANEKCMYLYINGIMSGMSAYLSNTEFPIDAEYIIINSEHCDIDLYNIRVYQLPLDSN